jgi:hypothetical protein
MFIPKIDNSKIITDSSPKWYIDGTYRNIYNQTVPIHPYDNERLASCPQLIQETWPRLGRSLSASALVYSWLGGMEVDFSRNVG